MTVIHALSRLVLMTLLAVQTAQAQIINADTTINNTVTEWQRQSGYYVTPKVKAQFPSYQAAEFARNAGANGFQNLEVLDGIKSSNLRIIVEPGFASTTGKAVLNSDQGDKVVSLSANQFSYLYSLYLMSSFAKFVEQFATVRLDVQPAPPRDYKVFINGEECPATERGLYKVLAGPSTVLVTRPPKPSCSWSGSIQEGKEQFVNCPF